LRSLHQTQLDTVNTCIANIHNKQLEPTDINVLHVMILTNIFKIFKIQDKIRRALNTVTAV